MRLVRISIVGMDKRELVARQCEAVANFCKRIRDEERELADAVRNGTWDAVLDVIGNIATRRMVMLYRDICGGIIDDIDDPELEQLFSEARRFFPKNFDG